MENFVALRKLKPPLSTTASDSIHLGQISLFPFFFSTAVVCISSIKFLILFRQ